MARLSITLIWIISCLLEISFTAEGIIYRQREFQVCSGEPNAIFTSSDLDESLIDRSLKCGLQCDNKSRCRRFFICLSSIPVCRLDVFEDGKDLTGRCFCFNKVQVSTPSTIASISVVPLLKTTSTEKIGQGEVSTQADAGEVSTQANAGEVSSQANADEISSQADADEISSQADADEISSQADADEVSSQADAGEISSKADAGEVSSQADAGEVSTQADAGEVSTQANADEVSSKADADNLTPTTKPSPQYSSERTVMGHFTSISRASAFSEYILSGYSTEMWGSTPASRRGTMGSGEGTVEDSNRESNTKSDSGMEISGDETDKNDDDPNSESSTKSDSGKEISGDETDKNDDDSNSGSYTKSDSGKEISDDETDKNHDDSNSESNIKSVDNNEGSDVESDGVDAEE